MCIHEKLAIIECGVIDNGNCISPAYNVYCDNCDTEIACGLCFVDARVLCERWLEYNTLKAKADLFDEAIEALETAIVTNPNFYDPSDAWELINKAKEL